MPPTFWDERYASDELIYGAAPNDFVAAMADRFPARGRALDLAAGEGRNALFLAARGLDVLAVDQSAVGLRKAERLATERGVALRTQVADLADFDADHDEFDVITSTFMHLPAALRGAVLGRTCRWLRPGGVLVLEAYAPDQIGRATGGPKDPALLASLDQLLRELDGLAIEHAAALVRDVREGVGHTGEASVVQVMARRP